MNEQEGNWLIIIKAAADYANLQKRQRRNP